MRSREETEEKIKYLESRRDNLLREVGSGNRNKDEFAVDRVRHIRIAIEIHRWHLNEEMGGSWTHA